MGGSVGSDGITLPRRRQEKVGVGGGVGSDDITLSRRPRGKLIVGRTLRVELSSNIGRGEMDMMIPRAVMTVNLLIQKRRRSNAVYIPRRFCIPQGDMMGFCGLSCGFSMSSHGTGQSPNTLFSLSNPTLHLSTGKLYLDIERKAFSLYFLGTHRPSCGPAITLRKGVTNSNSSLIGTTRHLN